MKEEKQVGFLGGGVWIGIYMYFILYDFDDFVVDDFFLFLVRQKFVCLLVNI